MIEKTLDITTKDGEMETFICHPERNGAHPAVFFLMDAHGIREELKDMARRLGTVGYYVLLPNLYSRAVRDTIYGPEVQQEGSDDDDVGKTNEAYRRLRDLAIQERKQGETVEQAFARVHADPKYRDLVSIEKRMHAAKMNKAIGLG